MNAKPLSRRRPGLPHPTAIAATLSVWGLAATLATPLPAAPAAGRDRMADERDRRSEHVIQIGWMQTRVYNEYIGLLPYEGPQFGLLYDGNRAMRPENLFQEWRIQAEGGGLMNPAGSRRQTSVSFRIHWGVSASVWHEHGFDLRVGGLLQWDSRIFYQPAYGNSSLQIGSQLQLAFNARLGYEFHIKEFPVRLHYRLSLPLVGLGFMPDFGLSYYEVVSVPGELKRQLSATGLHNLWNLQNEFGVDWVFRRCVLRLSYVGHSLWSRYKGVAQEWHSHGVQLGFVIRMENLSGR